MNPPRERALLLQGGSVVDGTGADRFVADVRIDGDRIGAIGPALDGTDAEGAEETAIVYAVDKAVRVADLLLGHHIDNHAWHGAESICAS